MVSHQHEPMDPTADQLIEETELKIDQQLALIESLVTSGKRTGTEMKALAALLDTLDEALEYKLMQRDELSRGGNFQLLRTTGGQRPREVAP